MEPQTRHGDKPGTPDKVICAGQVCSVTLLEDTSRTIRGWSQVRVSRGVVIGRVDDRPCAGPSPGRWTRSLRPSS